MIPRTLLLALPLTLALGEAHEPTARDLQRAHQARPFRDSHVIGPHTVDSFASMNKHLASLNHVETVPCEDLEHQDLNAIAAKVLGLRDARLNSVYTQRGDRRQLSQELEGFQQQWAEQAARIEEEPEIYGPGTERYAVTRDGKCAETVMWWIHHLAETAQVALGKIPGFKLPLMPMRGKVEEAEDPVYVKQISCSDCHTIINRSPEDRDHNMTTERIPNAHVIGAGMGNGTNVTCPVDPKTNKPSVWYMPESAVGHRLKRCDWDYNPPCVPCEGIGGLAWGDQQNQINYPRCKMQALPADIPKGNLTTPTWPEAFQVNENTILINQLSTGGRFPGADPCQPHNFKNQTETQWYDGTIPASRIHTYGLTDTSDIWTLPNGNMYIKIEKVFCICVSPKQNGAGDSVIGPLRYDFALDSVLVGREVIEVEYLNKAVLADHWVKGPHHFWFDVYTNQMVRGWQPYNGLNIYSDWVNGQPDSSHFKVDKSCDSGFLHKNISCVAPPS